MCHPQMGLEEWNKEKEKRGKLDLVENKKLESVAMIFILFLGYGMENHTY